MKTQLDDLNRDLRVAEMQLAHAILSIIYNIQ